MRSVLRRFELSDQEDSTANNPTVWPARSAEGLTLFVVTERGSTSHPLPLEGRVVIGRTEHADVRINDVSISRRHACIHIGERLEVEDLGSANGTVVRSTALSPGQRVEIVPGVAVELGSAVVIVQAATRARPPRAREQSTRQRRLMTHGYFEVRLEEACAQAQATGARFAIVRVHIEDDDHAPEILVDAVRAVDLVAAYAPNEYEIFLADATTASANELAAHLYAVLAKRKVAARMGVACYPADGRTPEALIERAHQLAQGRTSETPRIVVQDRVMARLHRLIERVAQGNISVLLLGETGVGKEVMAEAVHRASPRVDQPFVKLNCAALTESLFESELFGHEKGAFTGATRTKPGLIETAHGGTLFLDEVGEIPAIIQAKLLRVIEEKKVLRVGALAPFDVDVRFVSATNRNLEDDVARGRFREDLFYRLNGISLVVPPLRERVSEIEALARNFAGMATRQLGMKKEPQIAAATMALLKSYAWPGNIRELRNVMERAVLLAGDEEITLEHMPGEKMSGTMVSSRMLGAVSVGSASREEEDSWGDVTGSLEARGPASSWEAERQRIIDALERSAGNQSEAAKLLGMARRTLVNRLVTHKIPRPRKGMPE